MLDEIQQPTRICSVCRKEKSLNEYYCNASKKEGRATQCIACIKQRRDTDEFKDKRRDYYCKTWATQLFQGCKKNSKEKKLQFNITKEYILELFEKQKGMCYWFGIEMVPSKNSKDPQQPTVDRLVPDLGYVKDNVVLTCFAANMGRNTTSEKRFREFVNLMQQKKE